VRLDPGGRLLGDADAFTYLFQWSYSAVARECEEALLATDPAPTETVKA